MHVAWTRVLIPGMCLHLVEVRMPCRDVLHVGTYIPVFEPSMARQLS